MAQNDFGTINPATKTGTVLTADINSFRDALNSCHSGSTQPSYVQAGTIWVDNSGTPWIVNMYDHPGG